MIWTPALIIQAVMAGIQAAPKIEAVVKSGKDFITGLFTAGVIDATTQNAAFAYVDAVCEAAKAGIVPPAAQVQPDPES